MRRTLTLCRTGLAGAAAFALLTACGGGGDDSASSSSSASETTSSSSASSSSTGAAADTEFCQQAGTVIDQLNGIGNVQDPAQVAPALEQAAGQLDALEPPAEIASDWDTLVGGIRQLADAASTTDFTDQQQAAQFAQTLSQLGTQLQAPSANVETYLQNECGIDTESTDTAAPTS